MLRYLFLAFAFYGLFAATAMTAAQPHHPLTFPPLKAPVLRAPA